MAQLDLFKTSRQSFEITEPTRESLAAWLTLRGRRADDWLFPSRGQAGEHITTRQYARPVGPRLVGQWVGMIDLEPSGFGTRSLRRTKVSPVDKKTGNLRA